MGQKLGQHFLKNKAKLRQIAAVLGVEKGQKVVEIGPGHGELTAEIMVFEPAPLVAIEKDASLCGALAEKYAKSENFKAICGDALKILPEIVASEEYKIVGNLPYYISGRFFRILGDLKNKPQTGVFLLQKEVAERMAAKSGEMNLLAASVQVWAMPKIVGIVSRNDFLPPPKVESAIIKLEKLPLEISEDEMKRYFIAAKALFRQPRKTILNNLKAACEIDPSEIASELQEIGLSPELRPEMLRVENILAISKIFF